MMSVDDILARLADRFRLLTGGSRTALPRHQTLRAALDWGHQLLNDDERRLFRRLSVFSGPFELSAAEAVGTAADLPFETVLGHLSGLVDKSLVVPAGGPGGRTRCRMLETVRQYAAERLVDSGEGDEARRRHADHFLAMAEAAAAFERRPGQAEWLARLEFDHEDLRAALLWCRAHDHERWVRLGLALGWFWLIRGHLSEGREWLGGVIALPSLAPADRARAGAVLAGAAGVLAGRLRGRAGARRGGAGRLPRAGRRPGSGLDAEPAGLHLPVHGKYRPGRRVFRRGAAHVLRRGASRGHAGGHR
jgi:non-specific serine/threonine protein kinase